MPVPLLDLNRQNGVLHAELMAACERVLRSGHFIQGVEVEAFEADCARFLGVRHAIAVSSGTDAILVALMALGIGPGDEVICPSFTFFATAGCVARTGATPVFADSDPQSFNLDAADVARRLTPRTKALIPVHLFGQTADLDALLPLARAHGLAVIEDAAQALGARHGEKFAGTLGDCGTYSFFPSKNLGGFGDGGLVVTNRDDLAGQIRLLRAHGAKPKYYHAVVGGNFRLDALQCALLRVKFPHLPAYCAARQKHAAAYQQALGARPGVANGAGLEPPAGTRLVLPQVAPGRTPIWNQFTLRVPGAGRRDALRQQLVQAGIGTEIYYPLPLHRQQCFAHLPPVSLPVAERLAGEVLSVPVFPELNPPEIEAVIAALGAFAS
jgi:dTDP-4-amino-4,6-dideoxygalactose transaminase